MIKALIEDKIALKEYVVELQDEMDEMIENYNYNAFDDVITNLESIMRNAKVLKEEVEGIKSLTDDSDPYDLLVSNVLKYTDSEGQTTAYFLENMEYN